MFSLEDMSQGNLILVSGNPSRLFPYLIILEEGIKKKVLIEGTVVIAKVLSKEGKRKIRTGLFLVRNSRSCSREYL